jgi:hypothetical protein
LVCLVTAITATTIPARRITSQEDLRFDRRTGIALDDVPSRIDCVLPFPPDIHDIFLELDRKYRMFRELDASGAEPDFTRYRLTDDEMRALLSINQHIAENPV